MAIQITTGVSASILLHHVSSSFERLIWTTHSHTGWGGEDDELRNRIEAVSDTIFLASSNAIALRCRSAGSWKVI